MKTFYILVTFTALLLLAMWINKGSHNHYDTDGLTLEFVQEMAK